MVVTKPILQSQLLIVCLLHNETACKGRGHTGKVDSCTSEIFADINDGNVLKPFQFLDTIWFPQNDEIEGIIWIVIFEILLHFFGIIKWTFCMVYVMDLVYHMEFQIQLNFAFQV